MTRYTAILLLPPEEPTQRLQLRALGIQCEGDTVDEAAEQALESGRDDCKHKGLDGEPVLLAILEGQPEVIYGNDIVWEKRPTPKRVR